MKTIKRPSPRKRVVSISLRSDLLEEVDRRCRGRRSAFVEAAILRLLRATRRGAIVRSLEEYYLHRPDSERAEEDRVLGDFSSAGRDPWDGIDE